jgi:lipoprotein-releasing system permease protein
MGSSRRIPCLLDAVEWSADEKIGRLDQGVLHPAPVFDLQSPPQPPSRRGSGFLTPEWRDALCLHGLGLVSAVAGLPTALPPHESLRPGVVVGRELAYGKIPIGSQVRLTNGGPPIAATVSDTIGTGVNQVDNLICLIPLPFGQRLAEFKATDNQPARVSGYRIRCVPGADLGKMQSLVESRTGTPVRTWMQGPYCQVKFMELQRNILGLVMVCIQVIAVFIVYAVFSTLVAEKRHDIGVLLGLGAQRHQIAGAFLIAGLVACVAGGLLGWAIGWSLLAAINPFTRLTGIPLFPQDVMYTPDAPVSWSPLVPLFFIGVMTVVGLIAVLLPAWRASRIDPIETLRENE